MEYFILTSKILTTVVYGLALLLLCTFGIHRYYLSYLYSRNKNKIPSPKGKFQDLPIVTVQLPIFNEMIQLIKQLKLHKVVLITIRRKVLT